jgi:hypothetical protein
MDAINLLLALPQATEQTNVLDLKGNLNEAIDSSFLDQFNECVVMQEALLELPMENAVDTLTHSSNFPLTPQKR